MADEKVRRLERDAAVGDPAAAEKVQRELCRRGKHLDPLIIAWSFTSEGDRFDRVCPACRVPLAGAEKIDAAIALWLESELRSETYDQEHCSGRNDRGIAMPLTEDERRAITRHARRGRELVRREAERMGIDSEMLKGARHHALRIIDGVGGEDPCWQMAKLMSRAHLRIALPDFEDPPPVGELLRWTVPREGHRF